MFDALWYNLYSSRQHSIQQQPEAARLMQMYRRLKAQADAHHAAANPGAPSHDYIIEGTFTVAEETKLLEGK